VKAFRIVVFCFAFVLGVSSHALPALSESRGSFSRKIVDSAIAQTKVTRFYDPSYVRIPYPRGDVSLVTGVCADVIVRAFRAASVDLQQRIHEDMRMAFAQYPHLWGLRSPDSNIDHRRVPNIMTYFKRKGMNLEMPALFRSTPSPQALNSNQVTATFQAGDVVSWDLGNGRLHIGLVVDRFNEIGIPLVVHNIGSGARLEDVLFEWRILGHYRYREEVNGKSRVRSPLTITP
jgi:uncharacterized protein